MAQYWLMKSEPDVFSIDQLKKDKKSLWDGVRNYQARNFMMNDMQVGDQVLFYHSNAKPPGVAGVAKISKEATADPTQFSEDSEYFDPKAKKDSPRWFCVEVSYENKFPELVPLDSLREKKGLEEMLVIKKGQRLSIQPVTKKQFDIVCKMGGL